MNDQLLKGRLEDLNIAVQYVVATDTVSEAIVKQNCDPAGAHVLGRGMITALLAAAPLGPNERINVRWSYAGHLQALLVDAGADGTVRGLINPSQLSHVEHVEQLYGDSGEIRVVRSRGGAVRSSGTIDACFMDVTDDLAAFQCLSDQIETSAAAVIAFSDDPKSPVRMARGLMLQALPSCDLDRFQGIRDRLRHPRTREQLEQIDEADDLPNDLIRSLLDTSTQTCFWSHATSPAFRCTCSPEKMGTAVRCLSYADRVDIVKKGEPIEIKCHFCNQQYTLSIADCIAAWNQKFDEAS